MDRDLLLRNRQRQAQKADVKPRYRAVLCAANGSRDAGSVWANENAKLVYFQFFGSGGVGIARCEKIVPELGLGVYVGKTDDNLAWQVLEDDPFLRKTATDNRNYQSVSARDLKPGGRLFLWVDSRQIDPLATYPTPSSLSVNVAGGDYPYAGTRKTFAGALDLDLTASVPGAGLHRYVGLYLDSANTLQTVDGSTTSTANDPPEPTWPAGAFRLSVVRLRNGQTSIIFTLKNDSTNDILDRRMPWSDEQGSGGSPASETVAGIAEIATQAETNTGTDDARIVTPLKLKTRIVSLDRDRLNPIINGLPLVWQRGTSFAAIADGAYFADGWRYSKVGAMVHTVSQNTLAPSVAESDLLIPWSILVDCTTVDASIAAGDLCTIRRTIEGFNWLDYAQRALILSFWVRATKTGIHCVALRNSGLDRSYVAEYTINTTNTWEYKTITILASPALGTWNYETGVGIDINFALACGSTFQTTAGSWQTGNFLATANQVNACDSTSNDFRITAVRLDPGTVALPCTGGDRQIEVDRCLRYAWALPAESGNNNGQGAKVSTTDIAIQLRHPVTMRATPVLNPAHNISGYTAGVPGTTTVGLVDYARNAFYAITGSLTVALAVAGVDYSNIVFTAGTSWDGTAGNLSTLRIGPDVKIVISADL